MWHCKNHYCRKGGSGSPGEAALALAFGCLRGGRLPAGGTTGGGGVVAGSLNAFVGTIDADAAALEVAHAASDMAPARTFAATSAATCL